MVRFLVRRGKLVRCSGSLASRVLYPSYDSASLSRALTLSISGSPTCSVSFPKGNTFTSVFFGKRFLYRYSLRLLPVLHILILLTTNQHQAASFHFFTVMAEQTLNIPQLIAVVLVGFLAIRWFLSPGSPSSRSSSQNAGRQINPAHVEQIMQMFPQLDRRSVMWDLQRNGGSLQATTERLLSGRPLDTVRQQRRASPQLPAASCRRRMKRSSNVLTYTKPPPSFQPPMPTPTAPTASTTGAQKPNPIHPDLITRYNLSSRVTARGPAEEGSATMVAEAEKKQGWSANKNERAEQLKRRREEMVLAARRKMEERDRKSQAGS